jgi:hypothetical protein
VNQHQEIDPGRLGWPDQQEVKRTLEATTQLATHKIMDPSLRTEARQPGITHRRNCIVATDAKPLTNLSDTKMNKTLPEEVNRRNESDRYIQVFVEVGATTSSSGSGRITAFVIKRKSDYAKTLLDFIRTRFVPSKMWIDGAEEQDSEEIHKIYRRYHMEPAIITEPNHQYQNPAEVLGMSRIMRLWRRLEIKGWAYYNYVLPMKFAKYKVFYTVNLLNHKAYCSRSTCGMMHWKTPMERADGETPDISQFRFAFLQPVMYHCPQAWPKVQLRTGRSLGPSLAGNFLSQYILTEDLTVISRSSVESEDAVRKRFGKDPMVELEGEKNNPTKELAEAEDKNRYDTEDTAELEMINNIIDTTADEMQVDEREENDNYRIKRIVGRNKPDSKEQRKIFQNIAKDGTLTKRGTLYLEVEWKGYEGLNTLEPFDRLREDVPEITAQYIQQEFGDKSDQYTGCIRGAVRWANEFIASEEEANKDQSMDPEETINYNKMGIEDNAKIQFGKRVPKQGEAQKFESEDGHKWMSEAAKSECVDKLINQFNVFGLGEIGAECPEGYQEIKLKIVYSNSPEQVIKARCCAVGCGVDSGTLNRYFSVVDLTYARFIMVVALANELDLRVIDVKSAYVTCRAQEKVWVKKLPSEFGKHAGKSATVEGNLYGLNTAGAVWASSCRAQLLKMGFNKTRGDGAIYMRRKESSEGPYYEYICTFVDDFLIASKHMDELVEELNVKWEFKHSTNLVDGVRYVGSECKRNLAANTLDIYCNTYIEEALEHIKGLIEEGKAKGDNTFALPKEKNKQSPMLEDDHPETLEGEEAEFLDEGQTVTYQSLVGSLQWCCTLCRLDVEYPVKTLSSYNAAPRKGHAKRLMRVWSYLRANPKRGIRIDPRDFQLEDDEITFKDHMREHLQIDYGDKAEDVDPEDPEPLGKALTLGGFSDADHGHNKVNRRSTSGRVILLGRTVISWKTKNQVGCEGSSYGSELRAAALCGQELRNYRVFLRNIGVPVKGPSILLIDNAAALYAASNLATTLKAKHLSIDYHSLREWTSWGILSPNDIQSEYNWSDLFTKPVNGDKFWEFTNVMMVSPEGNERTNMKLEGGRKLT